MLKELQSEIVPASKIRFNVLSWIEIDVMIRLRNVLKKCIIKVTNSNVSFVFIQTSVKVPGRFTNIF